MKVYLASPLFSESERLVNDSISAALNGICDVHLPQRDGPVVERAIAEGTPPRTAARLAFDSDVAAIRACDILVAVLDGRALDEGVCVEVGYAKALAKHVVGFKSDSRQTMPWGNNPMIDGCVDKWVRDTHELKSYISGVTLKTYPRPKR
jgi:nucleoside 2-deoxyribosyltransferase